MALTGQQYTIAAGDYEATVVEVGAGLRRYLHAGTELTVSYGEDELPPKGCGATLVPWPNRLRGGRYSFDGIDYQLALTEPTAGNAIHGLGRWERWPLVSSTPAAVTLGLDLVAQTGWPFQVRVEVSYALHAELGLAVTIVATNQGPIRAPFGAGFHPYLSTYGHDVSEVNLRIPARDRLLADEAKLPIGTQSVAGTPYDLRRGRRLGSLRLDDAFTGLSLQAGRSAVELRTKHGRTQVWLDETFRYVQVFTLDQLVGERAAVAVEPMTCPADGFNSGSGLIVLEPAQSWSGSWGIRPV